MNVLFDCFTLAQANSDWWTDQLFGLDQGQRFVLLLVAIGCGTGIIISTVGIVAGVISSLHRRRMEADMKSEMLDRGMSADEIAKVVEAAPPKDWLERWAASRRKK